MSTIEDVLTPLSDQESSRVSMTSVVEPKGAELIFGKALATKAIETGIIFLLYRGVINCKAGKAAALDKFSGTLTLQGHNHGKI